jgi:hypothetical protein
MKKRQKQDIKNDVKENERLKLQENTKSITKNEQDKAKAKKEDLSNLQLVKPSLNQIYGSQMLIRPNKLSQTLDTQPKKKPKQPKQQLLLNYSVRSKAGTNPGNIPKTNQDNYFTEHFQVNGQKCYAFGVCDGHGVHGHEVSEFLRVSLPSALSFLTRRKARANAEPRRRAVQRRVRAKQHPAELPERQQGPAGERHRLHLQRQHHRFRRHNRQEDLVRECR